MIKKSTSLNTPIQGERSSLNTSIHDSKDFPGDAAQAQDWSSLLDENVKEWKLGEDEMIKARSLHSLAIHDSKDFLGDVAQAKEWSPLLDEKVKEWNLDKDEIISLPAASELPRPPESGVGVCTYYMKRGKCKFGQACKFSHDIANHASNSIVAVAHAGIAVANDMQPDECFLPFPLLDDGSRQIAKLQKQLTFGEITGQQYCEQMLELKREIRTRQHIQGLDHGIKSGKLS